MCMQRDPRCCCIAHVAALAYITDQVILLMVRFSQTSNVTEVRNSLFFIDHEGSLLCSQEASTGPYPEPNESNPHLIYR
jgi:hypothetical protein